MFESTLTISPPLPVVLTPTERTVLRALREAIQRYGAPSLLEIAELAGFLNPTSAWLHLHRLERKGFVAIDRGRHRGVRLLREE